MGKELREAVAAGGKSGGGGQIRQGRDAWGRRGCRAVVGEEVTSVGAATTGGKEATSGAGGGAGERWARPRRQSSGGRERWEQRGWEGWGGEGRG